MARKASIGRAELHAEVRPGNPQAVVPPRVDVHVRRCRHVALHAQGTLGAGLVIVMGGTVILRRRMGDVAARAELVAFVLQLQGMWIMAIAAADVLVEHLALRE